MASVILENTDKWRIDSFGNGAAYSVTHKPTMREAFIQYGDAASAFRENYDAMQEAYAEPASVWHRRTWDACLAFLCEDFLPD